MRIIGDSFRPPWPKMEIAQALGMAKILIIILVIMGVNPFVYIDAPTPGIWSWLVTNKVYGCMLVFFITGMVETNLISTGAFEIYLNNEQVWSKITSGRIPDPGELFNIIDSRRQTLFGGAGKYLEGL